MAAINIIPNGDGSFPHMAGKVVHEVEHLSITGLSGGMASGRPSVAIIIELPDGSFVFAQTSLRLLLTAADALKAAHGDPR